MLPADIRGPNPPHVSPASHVSPVAIAPIDQRANHTIRTRWAREDPSETLARWIMLTNLDSSGVRLTELMQTKQYAQLWYGARETGERLRAQTLQRLFADRPIPGGRHPDPRKPAPFSPTTILATAARAFLFTSIWRIPPIETVETLAALADEIPANESNDGQETRPLYAHARNLAWIAAYPDGRAPDIIARDTHDEAQQHFEIACCLGYIIRERARLMDADAPGGGIYLPRDTAITSVLHQFAIALLALPEDCPPSWTCACNLIRRRFNAPPPDHVHATGELHP